MIQKLDMGRQKESKKAAVIVAHPDDETLWAGGTILSHPSWSWFITTLCRGSDQDRASRFYAALKTFGATGAMADIDDGPEQKSLTEEEVQQSILELLPPERFDLIISHNPAGEYTRHRRHEEIGQAVINLWQLEKVRTNELWVFAYEDGEKRYRPRPIKTAHIYYVLPEMIWQKKYELITVTYGFEKNGFEAETTPRAEAFWKFSNPLDAKHWLENKVFHYESSIAI